MNVELTVATLKGRRERRYIDCVKANETFAVHRDLNDYLVDELAWNITHRPSGYAVFKSPISYANAIKSFQALTAHHSATGAWSFRHAGRIPKNAKTFGKALRAEFTSPEAIK